MNALTLSRRILMGLSVYDIMPSDYAWLTNRVLGTKATLSTGWYWSENLDSVCLKI